MLRKPSRLADFGLLDPLRGVRASTLLLNSGAFDKTLPGTDKDFELSEDTSALSTFISHSWRSPDRAKRLALYFYFFWQPAVILSVAFAALYYWMTSAKILQITYLPWYMPSTSGEPQYISDGDCGLALVMTVPVCLLAAMPYIAPLWSQPPLVFYDKLCIAQESQEAKLASIAKLGAYVARSKRMVICWDETYCTRLWTMFELAAFAKTKPMETLDFVPTQSVSTVCALFVMHFIACAPHAIAFHFFFASSWLTTWMASVTHSLLGQQLMMWALFTVGIASFFVPGDLYLYTTSRDSIISRRALEKQLESFSVDALECTVEEDREDVNAAIAEWFGDVAAFEEFVQCELSALIHWRLGEKHWQAASYHYLISGCLPHLFFGLEILGGLNTARPDAVQIEYRAWLFLFTMVFLFDPVSVLIVKEIALWRRRVDAETASDDRTDKPLVRIPSLGISLDRSAVIGVAATLSVHASIAALHFICLLQDTMPDTILDEAGLTLLILLLSYWAFTQLSTQEQSSRDFAVLREVRGLKQKVRALEDKNQELDGRVRELETPLLHKAPALSV